MFQKDAVCSTFEVELNLRTVVFLNQFLEEIFIFQTEKHESFQCTTNYYQNYSYVEYNAHIFQNAERIMMLSIGDWVLCKRGLDRDNSYLDSYLILCNFLVRTPIYFWKKFQNFFCPPKHKKLTSKVAHNPTRPPVFSQTSFCFVKLRQF